MKKTAIKVNHLGKKYSIGSSNNAYRTLREAISERFLVKKHQGKALGTLPDFIWALKDISFSVEKGEALGIIGRNGAGKSTLLKVLSRVTEPTEGSVEIIGRVGSLLEVGTGFHPELTGGENIYLNGAILGMKKNEIKSKFDEIVSFAEIEKFIDTPVKRYSSGMYLRLAFAVAAHLEPEILIVDEVLAVGDAEFQRKCLGKMNDVAKQGRTVLFVSHNMSAILRLTKMTLVIDKGKLILQAPTAEAVDFYLSSGLTQEGKRVWRTEEINKKSRFTPCYVQVLDQNGSISETIRSTEPFFIELEYHVQKPIKGLRVGVYLTTSHGEFVFTSFDTDDPGEFEKFSVRKSGLYRSRVCVPANLLNGGRYILGINASAYRIKTYFHDEQVLAFNVDPSGAPGTQWPESRLGSIRPALEWEIKKIKDANE
ncbi:MAG: ABC transporter ATP-binding protein [Anaerolineaceae bacterium]|nr:ABC transporter ATP-binding protein [Anaerolineaceae bacterium]